MKRDIVWTTTFKKDYKLVIRRNLDIGLLDDIIRALSRGETLHAAAGDHTLAAACCFTGIRNAPWFHGGIRWAG